MSSHVLRPGIASTLLPIIDACDNARLPQAPYASGRYALAWQDDAHDASVDHAAYDKQEALTPLFIQEGDARPVGFLRPAVLQAILDDIRCSAEQQGSEDASWKILYCDRSSWAAEGTSGPAQSEKQGDHLAIWGVCFSDSVNSNGRQGRSAYLDRLVQQWRVSGRFAEALRGWRDELLAIYAPVDNSTDPSEVKAAHVLDVERAACCLFAFLTYGILINAYVRDGSGDFKIWVSQRSLTKSTWPGYLDCSVGGACASGDTLLGTVVKECAEEASLSPEYVKDRVKAASLISYVYRNDDGYLQPEVEYLYDLEMPHPDEGNALPSDASILKPCDGEVDNFTLLPASEVMQRVIDSKFKPNCALSLIDFFIRHGLISAENEPNYAEIAQRLRTSLYPLTGPVW